MILQKIFCLIVLFGTVQLVSNFTLPEKERIVIAIISFAAQVIMAFVMFDIARKEK